MINNFDKAKNGSTITSSEISENLAKWRDFLKAEHAFLIDADTLHLTGMSIGDDTNKASFSDEMSCAIREIVENLKNRRQSGKFTHPTIGSFVYAPIADGYVNRYILGFQVNREIEASERVFVDVLAYWLGREIFPKTSSSDFDSEITKSILSATNDGVITVNRDNKVVYMNHAAELLTRRDASSAHGESVIKVFQFSGEPNVSINDYLERAANTGRTIGLSERNVLVGNTGVEFLIDGKVLPLNSKNGEESSLAIIFRDVSDTQDLEEKLSWTAIHDNLTGVYNRAEMERRVNSTLNNAKKRKKLNSFIHIGIDHFKVINDACGNAGGDSLLRKIAEILKTKIRSEDIIARLGGDEFGILLEGCNIENAEKLANNVLIALNESFTWGEKLLNITSSVGVVSISNLSTQADEVFNQSSSALAMAKNHGRSRVWVQKSDDLEVAKRSHDLQWVAQIASAIECDRLVLFQQKIEPVTPGEGTPHYELLLRMLDNQGNLIPPMAFIPTAERYGLMYTLDRWVIKEGFRLMPAFDPRATIAINLSAHSICSDDLFDYISMVARKFNIDPKRICFEITETAAIANIDRAKEFISKSRNLGFKFALDDFGAGFNSFSNLKALVVDYLKIDGSFVKNLARNRIDYTMVEAINRVGKTMGIQTIAEFVEDQITVDILKLLGVNYAQGYHIHKPEIITVK